MIVAHGGQGGSGGKMWNNPSGRSLRSDGIPLVPGGKVLALDSHYQDVIIGGPGGYGRASKIDPAYDEFGYLIPPIDSHNLPYGFITTNQPIRRNSKFNKPSSVAPTGGGGGGGYVSDNLKNLGLSDADNDILGGRVLRENIYTNESNYAYGDLTNNINTIESILYGNVRLGMGGNGGSVNLGNPPSIGNEYGGGGGGGGASRLYSAQNGADGGNGVCIIIEKI
jgi:hypothetical protein